MGDDRPITYEEDGKVVYRASSLGVSVRDLVASRMGITPAGTPEWLQEKFDQGNMNEPVIDILYQQITGSGTVGAQEEIEIPLGKEVLIRGHIDGRVIGTKWLVEYKAFSKENVVKFEAEGWAGFPDYASQVSLYMHALGYEHCEFVLGVKNDLGVVEEIRIFPVEGLPVKMGTIKAKIAKVERMVREGELPKTCDVRHYPCPYYFLNSEESKKRVEVVEDAGLDEMLGRYQDAHAREKKAEKEKDELKPQIVKAFDERWLKGEVIMTKLWTVGDMVSVRKSLSKEKLEADGIKIEDRHYAIGETRWPKIVPTKQADLEKMDGGKSETSTKE